MTNKISAESIRILMNVGAILRLDARNLMKEPPTSSVVQAVRVIRTHSTRDELATLSHVPYEPMPDELRRLLKELDSVPTAHEKAPPH
jgi:hypothetical protein